MSERPNILVVGSINMDLVVRAATMPTPGETVLGNDFTTCPGGKGANQAVAAARLGASVRMLGRVGDDAFGQSLCKTLADEGVDIDAVAVTPEAASGVAMIVVDGRGENSIVVASGANFLVTPDDLFGREDLFDWADAVLLQLELPLPTVCVAVDLARKHRCLTVLDPAPAQPNLPDEICRVDVISPNVSEAEILTGKKANEDRADKIIASDLIARGAQRAVLKLGSRGSMAVCADGHCYRIGSFKVDVVDSTSYCARAYSMLDSIESQFMAPQTNPTRTMQPTAVSHFIMTSLPFMRPALRLRTSRERLSYSPVSRQPRILRVRLDRRVASGYRCCRLEGAVWRRRRESTYEGTTRTDSGTSTTRGISNSSRKGAGRTSRNAAVNDAFFEENGIFPVVVRINISYRRPASVGDVLEVTTRVAEVGSRRVTIAQTATLEGRSTALCRGRGHGRLSRPDDGASSADQ